MIWSVLVRILSLPKLLFFLCLWMPVYVLLAALDMAITLNIATLVGVFVGCVGVAAVQTAMSPIRLWYPMTWFLLTSGVYYGFGPLLYYFGTPESVVYLDAYYPITDTSLWRSNLLTLVGIAGVIAVYLLLDSAIGKSGERNVDPPSRERVLDSRFLWKISLIFMIIGVPVRLLFFLPRALGLWDVVLPGAIEYLSVLSTLALVPLFLLRAQAATIFLVLLCFELGTAFVQLNKLVLLQVPIIGMLAWTLRGTTAMRLVWMGVLAFVVYALILMPLVSYGRIEFNVTGLTRASDAVALIQDIISGSAYDKLAALLPDIQHWWSRLNYANAQTFAMDAHDAGQTGDTFELAIWAFVPRILYPDKPIMNTGDIFNELVTGNPNSKSAPGMFAEGYWNAGWAGLIVVCVVMACCYWGWERYTRSRLEALQLQYLPVMWMGLLSAIQQDGWFVPGTFGAVLIAIVFHWLSRFTVGVSQGNPT